MSSLNECFRMAIDFEHVDHDGNGLVLIAECVQCGHQERTPTPGGPPGSRVEIPEAFRTLLLEHRTTHERPS